VSGVSAARDAPIPPFRNDRCAVRRRNPGRRVAGFGEDLPVEPGGSRSARLFWDREIRSCAERHRPPAIGVIIDACLDDRAGRSIARKLRIAESQVLRAPIDTGNDRVGGALELVIKAAPDQFSEHRIGGTA
jgi:hypothetical protein